MMQWLQILISKGRKVWEKVNDASEPRESCGSWRGHPDSEKIVMGVGKMGMLMNCGSWERQFGAVIVFRHYGSVLAVSETGFAAFWALNSRWPEHLG